MFNAIFDSARIDHTLLKTDISIDDLNQVCNEAKHWGFATVCVRPAHIKYVAQQLAGSSVKPISVVDFPLGTQPSMVKAVEAKQAVHDGAREIDMVINIGSLKSKDYTTVLQDIQAVVQASQPYPVKVIIETGLLTHEEKISACTLAKAAGASFVKTCTGFAPGKATIEDIALMRLVVGADMGIKASGGIRSRADAEKMLQAGATRIGASASVAIMNEQISNSVY